MAAHTLQTRLSILKTSISQVRCLLWTSTDIVQHSKERLATYKHHKKINPGIGKCHASSFISQRHSLGGLPASFISQRHSLGDSPLLQCLNFETRVKRNYCQVNTLDEEEEDKLYKWIELKVKGHDDAVLESYKIFVTSAATELNIEVEKLEKPYRSIYWLTLLKSRHIYKKHRVQYEMRTYFRVIRLKHMTGSTADVFLEYIERNLPEGVAMQVKKCAIERMPEHLTKPPEDLIQPAVLDQPLEGLDESIETRESSSDSSSDSSDSSDSDDENEEEDKKDR